MSLQSKLQNPIINYPSLLSQISSVTPISSKPLYVFTVQLYDITFTQSFFFRSPPTFILGIKFLTFPSIILPTNYYSLQKRIEIQETRSIYFSYDDLESLRYHIKQTPLCIVLVNKQTGKAFCSSRINLSSFTGDPFLNYEKDYTYPLPRRKMIQMYDENIIQIGEIDISLIIRREYINICPISKCNTKRIIIGAPEQCIDDPYLMKTEILLHGKYNKKNYEYEKEESNKKVFIKEEKKRYNGVYREKFIGEQLKGPDPITMTHNIMNQDENVEEELNHNDLDQTGSSIITTTLVKDNQMYIKPQPQFPISSFEDKSNKEKNSEYMNYDKLMKSTFKTLKLNKNKNTV